jgi:hypothetical protein
MVQLKLTEGSVWACGDDATNTIHKVGTGGPVVLLLTFSLFHMKFYTISGIE